MAERGAVVAVVVNSFVIAVVVVVIFVDLQSGWRPPL